jgi:hypothetical protein
MSSSGAVGRRLLLLQSADESELTEQVRLFQECVWDGLIGMSSEASDILRELAYDLDFFVADESERSEDARYFGPDRARQLINKALMRLRGLGLLLDAADASASNQG